MDTVTTLAAQSFRTTTHQNQLIIHDVPIFVECSRGENVFDAKWIFAAVKKAKQAESEGYLPPLHIRHHEAGKDDVKRAGMFRITQTTPLTFKGRRRVAVLADLIITDAEAAADIAANRLPYRSVEIFDVKQPGIGSLALLDHEAPFLELPMLFVSGVKDRPIDEPGVHPEHFSESGLFFGIQRGDHASMFFNASAMKTEPNDGVEEITDAEVEAFLQELGLNFKDDEDKSDDDSEDMEAEEGPNVESICSMIKSGEISVADMQKIMQAIEEQGAESTEDAVPEDPDAAAPAAAPGAEAMSAAIAKLKGQLDAANARLDSRDAAEKRREDVAVAMSRLAGRPIGSDPEDKLTRFHKEHGAEAFQAYVDAFAESFAEIDEDPVAQENFAKQRRGKTSEAAMKFSALGVEALEDASRFSAEWSQLRDSGHTQMSEERYVTLNMAQKGFQLEG